MRRVFILVSALVFSFSSVTAQVLLDADFDDKSIDTPIGLGGAEVGEPTYLSSVSAMVRDSPMASSALEFQDIVTSGTGFARFDFLDLAEVTSGVVRITCELWFAEFEDFTFDIRESGSASRTFATLKFQSSSTIRWGDFDTPGNNPIGTYEIGRPLQLRFEYDMDAGTYELELDGELLLEDETHGITDRGVGSVSMGCDNDADLLGALYVDNLYVVTPHVFADGFESGTTDEWSSVVP